MTYRPRPPTGGRPGKGDRQLIASRPPRLVAEEIQERAYTRGVPVSDYVAALLCQHVGKPELAPAVPEAPLPLPDEEFPMTG